MDADKALTGLTRVAAARAHAGDRVAAVLRSARRNPGTTVSSDKLGTSLVGLMKAQLAFRRWRDCRSDRQRVQRYGEIRPADG